MLPFKINVRVSEIVTEPRLLGPLKLGVLVERIDNALDSGR